MKPHARRIYAHLLEFVSFLFASSNSNLLQTSVYGKVLWDLCPVVGCTKKKKRKVFVKQNECEVPKRIGTKNVAPPSFLFFLFAF